MANTAKKAILRAKVEGALVDLLVQTNAENVMVDENTTLTAKLASIVAAAATPADITTAISALRTELMGEGVPAAYDTFKELADYIESHQEAADALTTAIGDKADKTTVNAIKAITDGLGGMATKDNVSEADLTDALKAKINAAADANHGHENKAALDTITADKIAAWDGKSTVFVSAAVPAEMKDGDLLFQVVEDEAGE